MVGSQRARGARGGGGLRFTARRWRALGLRQVLGWWRGLSWCSGVSLRSGLSLRPGLSLHSVVSLMLLVLSLMSWGSSAQAAVDLSARMAGVRLTVAVDPKNAPFAFLMDNVGHPQGYDIDIVQELQQRLGFELSEGRYYPMEENHAFEFLQRDKVDLFIGGITMRENLAQKYDVTRSVYSSGFSIMYAPSHFAIKSAGQLKQKKVGVKRDSPASDYIKGVMSAQPIPFDNIMLAYYQLSVGKLDAVVAERPAILYFAHTMPTFNLKVTDDVFDRCDGEFVFYLKKDSPYTAYINAALTQMEADGTTYKLRKKWIGE